MFTILNILKIDKYIMSFNKSKIHLIIIIIIDQFAAPIANHQFSDPLKSQRRNWPLICLNFSMKCTKVVNRMKLLGSNQSRTKPRPI